MCIRCPFSSRSWRVLLPVHGRSVFSEAGPGRGKTSSRVQDTPAFKIQHPFSSCIQRFQAFGPVERASPGRVSRYMQRAMHPNKSLLQHVPETGKVQCFCMFLPRPVQSRCRIVRMDSPRRCEQDMQQITQLRPLLHASHTTACINIPATKQTHEPTSFLVQFEPQECPCIEPRSPGWSPLLRHQAPW